EAARDSANEISVPVLMATITTIVVFLPITFMTGMGKYMFTPLAIAASLALVASYFVSRTVSPVCCAHLLRQQHERPARWAALLDWLYEGFAACYEVVLRFALRWRVAVVALVLALILPAVLAFKHIGQELFPDVDSGEFTIHMRATGGPRVEETE